MTIVTCERGRQWLLRKEPRFYVYQYTEKDFFRPNSLAASEAIGKWAVIDAQQDRLAAPLMKSRRGAIGAFERRVREGHLAGAWL
jgi:hypothetical protein